MAVLAPDERRRSGVLRTLRMLLMFGAGDMVPRGVSFRSRRSMRVSGFVSQSLEGMRVSLRRLEV